MPRANHFLPPPARAGCRPAPSAGPAAPSYRVVRNRRAFVKTAADPRRPRARRKSRPGIRAHGPGPGPSRHPPSRHPTAAPPSRQTKPPVTEPPVTKPPVTKPWPWASGGDRAGAGPAAPGCRGSGRAGDGAGASASASASAVSRGPRPAAARAPLRYRPGKKLAHFSSLGQA
jgi:hypothetical protein